MPVFEITSPEGKKYRITGATKDGAMAALKAHLGGAESPETNIVEQAGTGANEGIADIVGFPVDIASGVINAGTGAIAKLGGAELPRIENPVGGSASIRGALSPFMSEVDPQTRGQKFARGAMREFSANAIPGARAVRAAGIARPIITSATSAVGSEIGGELAEDQPEMIQIIARMLGGVAGGAAAIPRKPKTPSLEDVSQEAADRWAIVEGSDVALTKGGRDDLVKRFNDEFLTGKRSNRVSERNTPKAVGALEDIASLPDNPHLYSDIVDYRRSVGNNVAGALDPSEKRLGVKMKGEIDNFLKDIQPNQVTGTNAKETLSDLAAATDATKRQKNTELILDQLDKAGRRAARSGRGGNTVNTVRQNIDKIINSPKLRAGYSAEDLKVMEDIVNGTPTVNAMRLVSAMSPTTGALPLMGNLAAWSAAGATGNPLFAAPSIVGQAAKVGADAMTGKQVKNLIAQVLNGRPVPKRQLGDAERAVIAALLAGNAVPQAQ